MASLQELRKRLRSIQSTGQLAEAMRNSATAKYARLSRARDTFGPYAEACRSMLEQLGGEGISRKKDPDGARDCVVVLSSNRGMCGGFNAEFLRFLDERLAAFDRAPLLLVCGKKAASHLRESGIEFEEYPVSDVPDYQELKPLADRIRNLFVEGEADRVLILYQHFRNTLTQIPTERQLLPMAAEEGSLQTGEDLLFLPDVQSITAQLAINCFDAQMYALALENAAGAQAATLVAMRNACDNAEASAASLEVSINRRRQTDVTSSVIETASGNFQQGD